MPGSGGASPTAEIENFEDENDDHSAFSNPNPQKNSFFTGLGLCTMARVLKKTMNRPEGTGHNQARCALKARYGLIKTSGFLFAVFAALTASSSVLADEAQLAPHRALIEEIVVLGHRPDRPRVNAIREQVKIALEALLDSIERDDALEDMDPPVRPRIKLGFDPDEDSGPLIDEDRHQVAMSFIRPATVIRVDF